MQTGSNHLPMPRVLPVLLLLTAICSETSAQNTGSGNPEKKGPTSPSAPAPPSQPAKGGLDGFKLPSDAIIFVCEQAADPLRLLPRFIMIAPEKLKELLDENEKLKAKQRLDKPIQPSTCHIEGKIEGNLAHLEVRYEGVTDKPGALVALGCKQAQLTRASLDGQTPWLRMVEGEGFVMQVDKAGNYQVTVHYTLSLTGNSPTRTLELDLPRTTGTTVKLHFVGEVKDLRVNDKPLSATRLEWHNNLLEGPPGADGLNKLTLAWKGSHVAPGGPTVLAAEGKKIEVDIDEQRRITTRATLLLNVQGGQARVWKLLVPLESRLELAPADEARLTIETQDYPNASLRTLRLKEPSADPLTVVVAPPPRPVLPATSPRPGQPPTPIRVGIGPFAVLGATRQTGSVVVSNAVGNLLLQWHLPAWCRTTHRPLSAEEKKPGVQVHAFRYDLPPLNEAPPFVDKGGDPATLAFLELEGEIVRGRVEARVTHTFRLPPAKNLTDPRTWTVTTTIDARLLQPGVETLLWQLPPDWSYDSNNPRPEQVLDIGQDEERQVVLKLSNESWKTFQINLKGIRAGSVQERGQTTLPLPKLLGAIPGGFQVIVMVPDELELLPPQGVSPLLEIQAGAQKQVWQLDPAAAKPAEQIEVSWRPFRPEVRAVSIVDLELTAQKGRVQHELRLFYPHSPPKVTLRVPAVVASSLSIREGGQLAEAVPGSQERVVILSPPVQGWGDQARLLLDYSFSLPSQESEPTRNPGGSRAPLAIPLVWAASATQAETKVRIWSEPGPPPTLANDGWTELDIEEVDNQPRWPGLVLRSHRFEPVLTLQRGEQPEAPPTTVLVERALIKVKVGTDNLGYRAFFRIGQLSARHLDVEIPAGVDPRSSLVYLDGKHLTPEVREDGRLVRLKIDPSQIKTNSILELVYVLPRSGLNGEVGGMLQTVLQPPVLRGEPGRVLTRWQVTLPQGLVVLGPEGGPGSDRVWSFRRGLLTPQLKQNNADLDRWLLGSDGVLRGDESDQDQRPALLCWRGGLESVTVVHVPQQAWLLFCSLMVLMLALALWFFCRKDPKRGYRFSRIWLTGGLLAMVLVTVSLFWPTATAAVGYGSQPGLAVLMLASLVYLLLQEQRRRQLVFLPSFRRNAGSSMVRNNSTPPRARAQVEPSTVDVPKQS
jgi:hypothetical protein